MGVDSVRCNAGRADPTAGDFVADTDVRKRGEANTGARTTEREVDADADADAAIALVRRGVVSSEMMGTTAERERDGVPMPPAAGDGA